MSLTHPTPNVSSPRNTRFPNSITREFKRFKNEFTMTSSNVHTLICHNKNNFLCLRERRNIDAIFSTCLIKDNLLVLIKRTLSNKILFTDETLPRYPMACYRATLCSWLINFIEIFFQDRWNF